MNFRNFVCYMFYEIKNYLTRLFFFIFSFLLVLLVFFLFFVISLFIESGFELPFELPEIDLSETFLPLFNDYCNLTDISYTAILHDEPDNGSYIEVTEYMTFDVHAAFESNPFKELWRDLPEEETDGLTPDYNIKSVTQILDNGEEIVYTETPKMYLEDSEYSPETTMRWHHSDGGSANDELLLIYIPWTYREKLTFKVVYTLNNAVLKYNDCSELYLSLYSGNTIKKLNSYNAQILIPDDLMPSNYIAYTFGTSNFRLPYTVSESTNPGYHTFSINLDKSALNFGVDNHYIEFSLLAYGEDSHVFSEYAPNNYYSSSNALDECIAENTYYQNRNILLALLKLIILVISSFLAVILIIIVKKKHNKILKKNDFYKPEVDYEYFREIPSDLDPIFASKLVSMKKVFKKDSSLDEEYAAILLSLMRKKYVNITRISASDPWNKNNTQICIEAETSWVADNAPASPYYNSNDTRNITCEPISKKTGEVLEPLTTSEALYFELLTKCTHSNASITLTEFEDYIISQPAYMKSFVKTIETLPIIKDGIRQGYLQSRDYDLNYNKYRASEKRYVTLGCTLLLIINIISYFTALGLCFGAYTILGITLLWLGFYKASNANNTVLFSQYGINEQSKWYGLYNFLASNTLINEKEVHDVALWEKYLIYATAFGISENVIKAIKINAIEIGADSSTILNYHSYIHSSSYRSISKSVSSSIRFSPSRRNYGGGSGGGRGGRWWWRWPLIQLLSLIYSYFKKH